MKISNESLSGLDHLLDRSRDAQKGYVEASNHINSPDLRKWMIDYSQQREGFCTDLEIEIAALGGDPTDKTTVLGELHRLWIDLKGEWSDNDPVAILQECQRGEETALEDYQEFIHDHSDLPPSTMGMLNRHTVGIARAITQIQTMMRLYTPVQG